MSREIKFRAWDKDEGKMIHLDGIFNRRPFTEMSTFAQYESCPKYHELELMQYTGLKDKNGKEIYEGDILLFSDGYKHNDFKEVVEFKEGAFLVAGRFIRPFDSGGATTYQFKVIGNIYQNPELLNG